MDEYVHDYLIGREMKNCVACGRKDMWMPHRRGLCLDCFCYMVNHLADFKAIAQHTTAERAEDVMTMPQDMFDGIARRMGEVVKSNPFYWKGKLTRDEESRLSALRGAPVKLTQRHYNTGLSTAYDDSWAPISEAHRMRTAYSLSELGMNILHKIRAYAKDGRAFKPHEILGLVPGASTDKVYDAIRSMYGHAELLRKRLDGQTMLYRLNPEFDISECKERPRCRANDELSRVIDTLLAKRKPFDLYEAAGMLDGDETRNRAILRSRLNKMVTDGTAMRIKEDGKPVQYSAPKQNRRRK